MDRDDKSRFDSVYTAKVKAGKRRTYFFDVKRTKGDDFYVTLTESTKRHDESYERHKIFLYKEDFNRFLNQLQETIDYVKTELMPDFDYEQFERRQAEWEASLEAQDNQEKLDKSDKDDKGDDMGW